ncbi:hypothetical protein R6Z07M_002715 [Ovis aries]
MFLIICMGLLLLTPKVLSLPFDPQGNAFLSWAHSYAAFHNRSTCWICRALPPSSVEGFPWRASPLQGKDFLQVCDYLCQQQFTGPAFAWPGTDWDWIPQSCWLASNWAYWICDSCLWAWLHHSWIGRCTLGPAFTHGFIFSELPKKPADLPQLGTHWISPWTDNGSINQYSCQSFYGRG